MADGLTSHYRDGYLVVDVGRSHRKREWLATDDADTEAMARLIAADPEPVWLSVPTHAPKTVIATIEAAGLQVARPDEAFMRCALAAHPTPEPPAGYQVSVTVRPGTVIEVRVLASSGDEAASGLMAVVGEDAIAHRIETALDHRRRGLGSVVMGALVREALEMHAKTGLLFASTDGEHLYRRLGWEKLSDLVVARNRSEES